MLRLIWLNGREFEKQIGKLPDKPSDEAIKAVEQMLKQKKKEEDKE